MAPASALEAIGDGDSLMGRRHVSWPRLGSDGQRLRDLSDVEILSRAQSRTGCKPTLPSGADSLTAISDSYGHR